MKSAQNVGEMELYDAGDFGDARLKKCGAILFQRMASRQTVCLRQLAGNRAREVQFGRWLANDKVTLGELIANACARTGEVAAGWLYRT